MTGQRLLAIGCAVVAIVAARSWLLPSDAPVWLRGASPFTWTETRAERKRCETFAEMIGSKHPATYYYDEDPNAAAEVHIQHTLRAGDSLAFDGQVTRGNRVNYVFHCATANVRGHPGKHRSEIAEPWLDAKDWPTVDATEDRLRNECIDSLSVRHPTSVFSRNALMLRRIPGRGELMVTSVDTSLESGEEVLSCTVEPVPAGGRDYIWLHDPATEP